MFIVSIIDVINFVNPPTQIYEPLAGSESIPKQYLVYISDVHEPRLI